MGRPLVQPVLGLSNYPASPRLIKLVSFHGPAGDWLEEAAWGAPSSSQSWACQTIQRGWGQGTGWRRRRGTPRTRRYWSGDAGGRCTVDKGVGPRTVAVGVTVKLW